jgi:hypothetical protein
MSRPPVAEILLESDWRWRETRVAIYVAGAAFHRGGLRGDQLIREGLTTRACTDATMITPVVHVRVTTAGY